MRTYKQTTLNLQNQSNIKGIVGAIESSTLLNETAAKAFVLQTDEFDGEPCTPDEIMEQYYDFDPSFVGYQDDFWAHFGVSHEDWNSLQIALRALMERIEDDEAEQGFGV